MTTKVTGFFTIERNIINCDPTEIEAKLGFRMYHLKDGARVLLIAQQLTLSDFEQRGSTLYPGGKGLDKDVLRETNFMPAAWQNERLIKVEQLTKFRTCDYPPARTPAEQWALKRSVLAVEIALLKPGQRYWPRK